jgi:hypothetical protein
VNGVTRTYDGTTGVAGATVNLAGAVSASLSTWNGSAAVNDSLSLTYSGGSYGDRNAGIGKTVTLTSVGLSGTGAANYTVAGLSSGNLTDAVGVINKAALMVVAMANTKAFDGTTSAAALPTVSGLQAGDTYVASESYADAIVATGKTLTPTIALSDGNAGQNYTLTLVANSNGVITGTSTTPGTGTTPPPSATETPADPTVPTFRPSVLSEAGETEQAAPRPAPVAGNLLAVSEQLTLKPGAELASLAPAFRARALAAGEMFTSAYSDGALARTEVIAVNADSIRFTVADRTSLRAQFAVAVGSDIVGRYTVDSAGGSVAVSSVGSMGTVGAGEGSAAQRANPLGVRMSSGAAPLEYTVSVSRGVVNLTLMGAAARAVLAEPRDEALLKLLVGRAVLDATIRLKAGTITTVRVLGGA